MVKRVSQTSNCFTAISISLLEINKQLIRSFTLAAHNGDVSEVVKLLDAGVPVDSVVGVGDHTALRRAAHFNRTDVIRVLLQRGADVNKQSGDDQYTALHVAAIFNKTDAIEVLLKHGASTKIKDGYGRTPIDVARLLNYEAAVRLLERH